MQSIYSKGTSWEDFDFSTIDVNNIDFGAFLAPKDASHRWTGYYNAPETGSYAVTALGAGEGTGYRVFIDDQTVLDDWYPMKAIQDLAIVPLTAGLHKVVVEDFQDVAFGGRMKFAIANQKGLVSEEAKAQAKKVGAVVVVAGFNAANETEGADRSFALPIGQDLLIQEMAALNKKTIVAVIAGGSVDASAWIASIPAFLQLWYPGEQGGTALAEVLFGDVNPSGRLPISYEKQLADNPSFKYYYNGPGTKRIEYKEGIFIGYRGYDHNHTAPLFPFGYGLSYTTFAFSDLAVKDVTTDPANPDFEVSFDVKNTGSRAGAEVAQVYVSEVKPTVPRPVKELKGFSKVSLAPGETRRVTVPLDLRSFAFYDVDKHHWQANAGSFTVQVGPSSAKLDLVQTLTLKQATAAKP